MFCCVQLPQVYGISEAHSPPAPSTGQSVLQVNMLQAFCKKKMLCCFGSKKCNRKLYLFNNFFKQFDAGCHMAGKKIKNLALFSHFFYLGFDRTKKNTYSKLTCLIVIYGKRIPRILITPLFVENHLVRHFFVI